MAEAQKVAEVPPHTKKKSNVVDNYKTTSGHQRMDGSACREKEFGIRFLIGIFSSKDRSFLDHIRIQRAKSVHHSQQQVMVVKIDCRFYKKCSGAVNNG